MTVKEGEPGGALVFGATGFIGRWLAAELLGRGRTVAAAVRDGARRGEELREWLRQHGVDERGLVVVDADITRPGLGLGEGDRERLAGVRDVFNAAALFRFGLGREEARRANVDGAVNVVRWAAGLPRLRRLVHVSGYRVASSAGTLTHPVPAEELDALYRRLGAYAASKLEGDAAVRAVAEEEGIPLTAVHPATVIGHSATGEAEQYIGLAEMVRDLWAGRLPRVVLPVGLVRRLPRALTGVEPETLSFLSEERYDTSSADALAKEAGLSHPPVEDALRRWADRLVADRFGA
jgi:nucleoside-diphosphate-sugar epimerase